MRHAGKRVKAWSAERVRLKRKFLAMEITTCELRYDGCWIDNGLGFGHHSKRRNLKPEQMGEVILICNFCHDSIEVLPHDEMYRIVTQTIAGRKKAA